MLHNKYIYTILKIVYISLLPLWLINLEWHLFLITYLVYWVLGDWIISLFLHRYGAHNLWVPPDWLRKTLSIFGAMTLQGNPMSWAAWHRTHHRHVDTEKDPHSPKYKSLFYIVFLNHFHTANYRLGIDRARDTFFVAINKYEGIIALTACVLFYMILPFKLFLVIWAAPVAFLNILPGLGVNYLCHAEDKPKNKLYLWPIIFSECMHADHHNNVKLIRNCWDPFAKLVVKLGWATYK